MKRIVSFNVCILLFASLGFSQQSKYKIPVSIGILATNKHHKSAWGLQAGIGFQKSLGRNFNVQLDVNGSFEYFKSQDIRKRTIPFKGNTESINNEQLSVFMLNLPLTFGYTFSNKQFQPIIYLGIVPKFKLGARYKQENLYYLNNILDEQNERQLNANNKDEIMAFRMPPSAIVGASFILKNGLSLGLAYQGNFNTKNSFIETMGPMDCIIFGYGWNSNRFIVTAGFDLGKL